MKTCSKCGVEKDADDFHRQTRSPDGRCSVCKSCENARNRLRYAQNPEKKQKQNRRWAEEHPSHATERMRAWREKNPERSRAIDEKGRGRHAAYMRGRNVERREVLDAYKRGKGCADCGTPEGDLHFDHREDKRFSIAVGVGNSWDVIWAEVAKCDVRCASCHSKRHAGLRVA